MAIENNLPIIFDTATQTEDGLMSYRDKIKLDTMEENLTDKLSKSDLISSSQLDTRTNSAKIQLENLSQEVLSAMAGNAPINAVVSKNSVTTTAIVNGAVTIDKIDKRFLLGNVVAPAPLNFSFDTKKVTINIPKGTLLMLDAVTKRNLVTNSDTNNVTINLNYPTDFDGLNYIVSDPNGTMSMVNHRKSNTISSTNSIVALIYLTKTFEASIVMHGSYTINGLAQGIGTESTALLGTGKIVFDQETGIIDFTEAPFLHLVIGGVFDRVIENQASIRLTDYSEEAIYSLYWNKNTQSLETSLANISSTATNIEKIALIKDGRIIPYVNSGIFYSKPRINAPYYTEGFEHINNIVVSTNSIINIKGAPDCIIEIPEDTTVSLNQIKLKVKNTECLYKNRTGIHYILFNLDNNTISCRLETDEINLSDKNIVLGTLSISSDGIKVSGNFEYTINDKTAYEDDLTYLETLTNNIEDTILDNIEENKLLITDEIYLIEEEGLPIYETSSVYNSIEGNKLIIEYNKDNDEMNPKVNFINGDTHIDKHTGDRVSLVLYDKYNTHKYLKKDINIKHVPSDIKKDNDTAIKVLCIGDDLINDKTLYYIKNKLIKLDVDVEMLGTMVNSGVYGEGRDGWFYSTFVGASGRGLNEGKINPQTASGDSSILLNPFIRIANADDKAKYPTDCYRVTGSYTEKNYYNDTDKNGAFYIFDFANYMEVQGITDPDIVVLAIKPETVGIYTDDITSVNMLYLRQIVKGIRLAAPDAIIALVPQYGLNTIDDDIWKITSSMVEEVNNYVKASNRDKIKIIPSWIHMNRELGSKYEQIKDDLYFKQSKDKLSETAKIELANSIVSFIMNMNN